MVLNSMVEAMMNRTERMMGTPSALLYILLGVWLLGSLIFAVVSFYTQRTKTTYYLANFDFTTDEEKAVFDRISSEILGKNDKLILKKTDAVNCIMVIGYSKKYLLMPDKMYTIEDLEMIFRHECTHIKNKDLLLKLLVHLYCCIFWWNPFSYLLKYDLGFTLEMKCDLSAAQGLSDLQVNKYFDALTRNCHKREKKDKNYFFICAELSDDTKNKDLVKRTKALAQQTLKWTNHVAANIIVAAVFVAIFAASYVFIWQPFYSYETIDDNYNLADDEFIVDGSNGYLIPQENGDYMLYFGNSPIESVSKEDVEKGLYIGYPILEK